MVLIFLIFQDDLLEIAVGAQAQSIAAEVKSEFICGELDVDLSKKQEANLPFASIFEFIGAEFNTTTRQLSLAGPLHTSAQALSPT